MYWVGTLVYSLALVKSGAKKAILSTVVCKTVKMMIGAVGNSCKFSYTFDVNLVNCGKFY